MRRSTSSTVNPIGRLKDIQFPTLPLPLPIPYPVMESKRADTLPHGSGWQFEPKWDGFRCLVFRAGREVVMQSKAGQSLARYFPELMTAFLRLPFDSFILDGEIVVFTNGALSFDHLLMRIHPAESRVNKLARETPATFIAFDLLYDPAGVGTLLVAQPLTERRLHLEQFFTMLPEHSLIQLTPATTDFDVANGWFKKLGPFGCDGIMAKKLHEPYHSGDREAMVKVKRLKTADCVVGGFRYAESDKTKGVGSVLLGLYDETGTLHHVGHTSAFSRTQRRRMTEMVEPLKGGSGFNGRAPGGPSRWSPRRSDEWQPVDPVLVCEVRCSMITFRRVVFDTGLSSCVGGRRRIRKAAPSIRSKGLGWKVGCPLFLRAILRQWEARWLRKYAITP